MNRLCLLLLSLLLAQTLPAQPPARPPQGEPGYVPTVSVRTRPAGQQVEVQAKVFQPFFTTKPAGEGTGLGLSLSYDITTQGHGRTLTVESRVGKRAAFTICSPVSPS